MRIKGSSKAFILCIYSCFAKGFNQRLAFLEMISHTYRVGNIQLFRNNDIQYVYFFKSLLSDQYMVSVNMQICRFRCWNLGDNSGISYFGTFRNILVRKH